jgi:hypothetical protein
MHTIDLLEEALWLAAQSGWQVRHEWLASSRGGACRLGTKHLLFVDRSLTSAEQLDQVLQALRDQLLRDAQNDPFTAQFLRCINEFVLSHELRRSLGLPISSLSDSAACMHTSC